MEFLGNGIIYILEIVKFYLAFRWMFGMKKREGAWKYLPAFFGTAGFAAWLTYMDMNPLPAYLAFIVIEMKLFFQENVIKIIFVNFWFASIIGTFDEISKITLQAFFHTADDKDMWVEILSCVVTIATEIIFGKIILKINGNKAIQMSWKYFACFFAIGWGYSYVMGYMWIILRNESMIPSIHFDIILMGAIMYGTMIMLAALAISRDKYREKEAFNRRLLEMQEEQYKYLEKREKDIRGFRHDMKEHMLMIQKYCETEENQELKEYLKKINIQTHMEEKRVTVHNREADVILNQYLSQAKELGIRLDIKGQMPAEHTISPYDLCVIFSNLLKNGIEAAKDSQQKRIELIVGYENNMMMIHMKNDYAGERKKKNGKYFTTKGDGENHGIGMENVRECVEKYHGNLVMEEVENQFFTMISMDVAL